MNKPTLLALIALAAIAFAGCGDSRDARAPRRDAATIEETGNAVYYWKTRFELSLSETAFLQENDIKRIYLRLFDVDYDSSPSAGYEKVIPVGTTSFYSSKPEGMEIVPVVFITPRALEMSRYGNNGLQDLADKIVTRALNMADYHDLGPVREIQLDCDWTESLREDFYSLCKEVKVLLQKQGVSTSATIRLHQLAQEAPPVDRGVLMVYNTGALRAAGDKNSILSIDDVNIYLKGKEIKYSIPLDFAWPTFGWGVWFRDERYSGLLHKTDYSSTDYYQTDGSGIIEVTRDHVLEGHELKKGDRIRLETSEYSEIIAAKDLIAKSFPGRNHRDIIYHLDSLNLSKYSQDEIHGIFGD